MNFSTNRKTPRIEISDCGFYRIETTTGNFDWLNGYFDPTRLHAPGTGICIGAGTDRDKVKAACIEHAERLSQTAATAA